MPGLVPARLAGKVVRYHTVVHLVEVADHTQLADRSRLVRPGVVRLGEGNLAVEDIDLVVDPKFRETLATGQRCVIVRKKMTNISASIMLLGLVGWLATLWLLVLLLLRVLSM